MKYDIRFGDIAIDMGFASIEQLKAVLDEQLSNLSVLRLRPTRLIGEVFFEKGWMSLKQIDAVLARGLQRL